MTQPPVRPIDAAEFARLLRIGHGRAVLHVKTHDATEYRDVIVQACTRISQVAYDPQSEGSRATYLLEIIEHTGEMAYYRDEMLKALPEADDDRDLNQLFELLLSLARRGDEAARQAVYDRYAGYIERFIQQGFPEVRPAAPAPSEPSVLLIHPFDGLADAIVASDRIAGLLFVAEQQGHLILANPEFSVADFLTRFAEERLGHEVVWRTLRDAQSRSPALAAFFRSAREAREAALQRRYDRAELAHIRYDELRRALFQHSGRLRPAELNYLSLETWGTTASDAEIQRAAADLAATSPEHADLLLAYLRIFWRRPFPLDPQKIIPLVEHPHERVQAFALSVVSRISHPAVRQLGFRLLERASLRHRAFDMLENNYQFGDHAIIARQYESETDQDTLHGWGMSIKDISKSYPDPLLAIPLNLAYERGPCSACRRRVVEQLIALDAFPAWMAEECLHDADLDTRDLARCHLDSHPNSATIDPSNDTETGRGEPET
jgi:hypothetical protein